VVKHILRDFVLREFLPRCEFVAWNDEEPIRVIGECVF
jgi:hypothetical protein